MELNRIENLLGTLKVNFQTGTLVSLSSCTSNALIYEITLADISHSSRKNCLFFPGFLAVTVLLVFGFFVSVMLAKNQ